MRRVHCRKCWQQNALLTQQCTHCGDIDKFRFGRGLAELLLYMAGGAAAIVVTAWGAMIFF